MSVKTPRHVLITGPPGVGKTTLVKKVCDALKTSNVSIRGFYTEELRDESNKRAGFDVVTLDGKREKLARTLDYLKPNDSRRFKVGQYFVSSDNFEQLVLPIFRECEGGVLVLDEIGKMELFSSKFESEVKNAFKRSDICILATVPINRGNLPLVQTLVANPLNHIINVDRNNRNALLNDVMLLIRK